MKLRFVTLLSSMALIIAAVTPAFAGQLNWNFYSLTGMPTAPGSATWDTSSSVQTNANTYALFTQGGVTLQAASAVTCAGITWCDGSGDLYSKNAGPGEQGLGLTNDAYPNNEISNPYGIALFVFGNNFFSSVQVASVQSGETWSIWGSTTNGCACGNWVELGSGTGDGSIINFSVTGNYRWILLGDPYLANQSTGTSNDVLLMGATTVPEPGTLALLAVGLAALGFTVVRRRKLRTDA